MIELGVDLVFELLGVHIIHDLAKDILPEHLLPRNFVQCIYTVRLVW